MAEWLRVAFQCGFGIWGVAFGIAALMWTYGQHVRHRKIRRLQDEYIKIVETRGFRDEAEGRVCIDLILKGEYETAVRILKEGIDSA